MNLYGSQSNAEAFCNFSIPCAGSKESGELELSFCERSDSMKNICRIRFAAAPAEVKVHAVGDGLNEPLVIDGLLDEIYGAFLESRDGQINVAVAGDENDGQADSSGRKEFLRFHSAHARHADVKYDAAGFGGNVARKELFGSSIVGNLPAVGFEGESQRFAQGIIVVDDSDEAAGFGL